jgi:hypothetical protein
MAAKKDFNFKTIKKIGVVSDDGKAKLELRITQVDDGEERFDLRKWWKDDKGVEKMGKGIRLSGPELMKLSDIIDKCLGDE